MARSKNVDSWIFEHDPAIRQICVALRDAIMSADPEIRESIKWSNPVYEKNGKLFYISANDSYAMLGFFTGARLADAYGRIEGTGKSMRHIKVRALEDIDFEQLESWVREALELDRKGA